MSPLKYFSNSTISLLKPHFLPWSEPWPSPSGCSNSSLTGITLPRWWHIGSLVQAHRRLPPTHSLLPECSLQNGAQRPVAPASGFLPSSIISFLHVVLFFFLLLSKGKLSRQGLCFMHFGLCPAESSGSMNVCGMNEGVRAQRCPCPVLSNSTPQRRVPSLPLSLPALCLGPGPVLHLGKIKANKTQPSLQESQVSMQSTHMSTHDSQVAQWIAAQDSE